MSLSGVLARTVRQVRQNAGLTQVELARRMERSQTVVSLAETGGTRIGERYVRRVMEACGLLVESAEAPAVVADEARVVGLDPETGEVVRQGSERDEQLRAQYVWWSNGDIAI